MSGSGRFRLHACVLLTYAMLAIAYTWPLAANLPTHVTGPVGGDTGVYIWNQWVFRHELIDNRSFPYFTEKIFGAEYPANLGFHNYTRFQNLIATPLMRFVGVIAAFNLVYLLMTVLNAYAAFLLARHVTGRVGEAWLAGLLFAWSPLLVTRGMGHFSLVAAAPLAVFLLLLMRADGHERLRDAVAMGVAVGWAASTDMYYGVYCLLLGAVFLVARIVYIEPSPRAGHARAATWSLDALILSVAALVVAMVGSGGWELTFLGQPLRMRSLYTPMLVLTALLMLRVAWQFRASVIPVTRADVWRAARLVTATGIAGIAVMSPVLYAAAVRMARPDGSFVNPAIFWRSSPSGLDLLAYILPNPNHPLTPQAVVDWLAARPHGYLENVASVPLVALGILLIALRRGWRPSVWWAAVTLFFGALALGPFIHVAGTNTFIPGPWALLRYVPLIGLARTPARFSVVMVLGLAVLIATALAWLGRRYPGKRRLMLVTAGLLLAFELLPAPRTLHSAEIPQIYRHVAAAPAGVKLLELPFGIRDGTSSYGNFSARTQFYQTGHGKTIIGGYVSRLSARRVAELRDDPVRYALALLSEGRELTYEQEVGLLEGGPAFVRRVTLGFVMIDRGRVSDEFRGLVLKAFRLEHVETEGWLSLYATDAMMPR